MAPMRVHHLDCCTMCPFPAWLVDGHGSFFARGLMVAHCLLVETPSSGLVLVDTGVGTADIAAPIARLGRPFVALTGFSPRRQRPAIEQVKALGFDPRDVRHLVPTHLDVDHAGGLADFPWAKVHVHADEKAAALARVTLLERHRYRPLQIEHAVDWATYASTGETWRGLPAVRSLAGLPAEILAIPMPGHTRGHACIAVESGGRWLVHSGDAYFHHGALTGSPTPHGGRLFERVAAIDYARVLENHVRLGELARDGGKEVEVFCAHDPTEYERLRGNGA